MTSRYDGLITQITLPKGLDYDLATNLSVPNSTELDNVPNRE